MGDVNGSRRKSRFVVAVAALLMGLIGCGLTTTTDEVTDYRAPRDGDPGVVDDRLAGPGPAFEPGLISPTPVGDRSLNLSAAVLKLDVPMILPDSETSLATLYPAYKEAVVQTEQAGRTLLPSINMIDGKAKQFDDGLMAALELAHYRGLGNPPIGQVALIERFLAKVGPDSPASPFLAAGLELAGKRASIAAGFEADKRRWLADFRSAEARSKPVGHATWSPELADAFRFARFFSRPFGRDEPEIPRALAAALAGDEALRADHGRTLAFLSRLTNPSRVGPIADRGSPFVALFPPPTSREAELFDRIFPHGAPPNTSLMDELIARVESGEVRLGPRPDGGWYDHQVFALEPLLLPQKADEQVKLLLTRSYKRRRIDAFRALMTKRRETHQIEVKSTSAVTPEVAIAPRLRVEPCPTYYLRTARAYGFLADSLDEIVGEASLRSLHGLRDGGSERPLDLRSELDAIRSLFFGLALVSSEDIGQEPPCLDAEGLDAGECHRAALAWLAHPEVDPDLAVDTRVAVPILAGPSGRGTRTWATLGVRMAKLDVTFARPPRTRPVNSAGPWAEVRPGPLPPAHYLIAVDEFAEVDLKGLRVLDRAEFRRICDEGKSRERIVDLLGR